MLSYFVLILMNDKNGGFKKTTIKMKTTVGPVHNVIYVYALPKFYTFTLLYRFLSFSFKSYSKRHPSDAIKSFLLSVDFDLLSIDVTHLTL